MRHQFRQNAKVDMSAFQPSWKEVVHRHLIPFARTMLAGTVGVFLGLTLVVALFRSLDDYEQRLSQHGQALKTTLSFPYTYEKCQVRVFCVNGEYTKVEVYNKSECETVPDSFITWAQDTCAYYNENGYRPSH